MSELQASTAAGYSPSPRPTFDVPTLITRKSVTRHIWGDAESGEVMDWIYVSSDKIHALVFGLAPGGGFRHSPEFRTVFGADELLHVLSGAMIIANPETGEVRHIDAGSSVFFRADTWHHAFAHGEQPLRVIEVFAPPPSNGTSGAYARTRPYLEHSNYEQELVGVPARAADGASSFVHMREADIAYRLDGNVLSGLLAATEHLIVSSVSLSPSSRSAIHEHPGDEVVYGLTGRLIVRAWFGSQTFVFEAEPHDLVYLPQGTVHEYRNFEGETATALVGVAPGVR
ncbi:hypothetical protein BH18ACT5_BH18ACT5_04120 [soil metagenome]